MTATPRPQPHPDAYDYLFAANDASVYHHIGNALFCLTTLVQDDETRKAAVDELNDAMVILRTLKADWLPPTTASPPTADDSGR